MTIINPLNAMSRGNMIYDTIEKEIYIWLQKRTSIAEPRELISLQTNNSLKSMLITFHKSDKRYPIILSKNIYMEYQ